MKTLSEWSGVGDPLADQLIKDFADHGPEERSTINRAIATGDSRIVHNFPAARALLDACQTRSPANGAAMQRGCEAYLSIGSTWILLSLGPGSLTHTYSAPSIAKVLAQTGNLIKMAERRLVETAVWNGLVVRPGGLEPGMPGYVHTLQVRLLHARVRYAIMQAGSWDGRTIPINQIELVRTWLDFTFVPFKALQSFGIGFNDDEIIDLYQLWHRIAQLLGIDPELYARVKDQPSGAALLAEIDAGAPPPDNNSAKLTEAMLDATAMALNASLPLGYRASLGLARATLRQLHGDQLADQLRVPRSIMSCTIPLFVAANRLVRLSLRTFSTLRTKMIARTIAEFEAESDRSGPTTYQRASTRSVSQRTELVHDET